MDINLLALNLGNSRLAMGAFSAGELGSVKRLSNSNSDQWVAALADVAAAVSGRDSAVVAASVNPKLDSTLEAAVEKALDRRIVWIGRDVELPIPVLTDEPELTGIDRILNVAAAYEQMGNATVVVDSGTALTIDVCNDSGEFVGGAIAPGASLMLQALHEKTAKLPLVDLAVPEDSWGKNTEQAIRHGVFHGVRGMVKEIVENYATALGQWPDIIATGGDAQMLFGGWDLIHAVAPDLTLYGIALAYTNHHIKHGI
jgi:type III pantothenate kinase